ncbi:STAS domain-containing protein (plasmid) [Streptomyces sp. CA-294286]|uniref:STAS domain-containing protein n=1 Tax=Streptomyces sp. CA-294286 TaxID=3240070 RepID=UPI003D8BDD2C
MRHPAQDGTIRLVLDLTGVTFLDSAGINTLLYTHRTMTATGGWLRLICPLPHTRPPAPLRPGQGHRPAQRPGTRRPPTTRLTPRDSAGTAEANTARSHRGRRVRRRPGGVGTLTTCGAGSRASTNPDG